MTVFIWLTMRDQGIGKEPKWTREALVNADHIISVIAEDPKAGPTDVNMTGNVLLLVTESAAEVESRLHQALV